jgi:Spy/CpxP family protein refolding chaperone
MPKSRVWFWLLVPAALVVGLFTFARAGASGPFCHGPHGHAPAQSAAEVEQHMNQKLEHLLDAVDASAAQRSQMAAITKQLSPELFAVMGEGRSLRSDLKNALLADKIDTTRIEALRARLDTVSE